MTIADDNRDENSIASKHADEESDESFFRRQFDKAKEAMQKANFCRRCGGDPTFTFQGVGEHMAVFCETCGDSKGVGYAKAPAEAVAAWNALPESFPCAGFKSCENRVGDEDGVCGDCEARSFPEGGCPGCGGSCLRACR